MSFLNRDSHMETVLLEALKVQARTTIHPYHIQQLEAVTWFEPATDHLVLELRGLIMGIPKEPIVYRMSVDYDAWESWWQHTKEVHFPTLSKWLRRPPRRATFTSSKTMSVTPWETYPEIQQVLPLDNYGRARVVFVRGD